MKRSRVLLIGIAALLLIVAVAAFTTPEVEIHEDVRTLTASKEIVWEVISDVPNYHNYATGLSGVTIISGEGKGMIRACSDELGTWKETCTSWDEGSSYSFRVDTGTGFPYPFKKMIGTWSVYEIDENFSEIIVRFEYQFPYRWMHWFFNDDTHKAFDEGDKTLLDNWEKAIAKAGILGEAWQGIY
ncbi:MAG: SRPBCC family protein [Cyclobacteriaceae bacterium]